ncbi:MAG TPA: 50S ribosomal protein L15 [Anaerohalosphaeraceae bacterium]|nr:50S ribosomal protein L15 [Anaerohalosphaeraceae bacterium]HOL31091.1 50S ribosomal protein L15 [Anaerohalosphaeraceae bacterium]HPC64665.1 50S ribosomal protein L15 [Anaerohalosphaeraceae bacterium]HPO69783.1 50S ribosomal protein L15 [Anaerohalosphaeraceae bacterium]HRS71590.1 50S ribosomal protein L15 [Anaerohalosphaeraceae bacterium]
MLSNEITQNVGAHPKRKRVGRGRGSGHGKTCGRGHKGNASRSGSSMPLTFEGGQMQLFRRLPKRGFNNAQFSVRYEVVNLSQLERVFSDGTDVGLNELVEAGLVGSRKSRVKILGDGELTKKLNVTAHKFSKSAQEKISGCGGSVKVVA